MVMLNSYSNAKHFFIAFSHVQFCFFDLKYEIAHGKTKPRMQESDEKKCIGFEYEFSLRPSLFIMYGQLHPGKVFLEVFLITCHTCN